MSEDLDSILEIKSQKITTSPSRSKPSEPQEARGSNAMSSVTKQVEVLTKRYRDSYLVARAMVSTGTTIKVIGFIAGILIVLVGIFSGSNMDDAYTRFGRFMLGLLIGVIVSLGNYIFALIISTMGQILKASLDSAVNSSPFLDNEQRARIMSLPDS